MKAKDKPRTAAGRIIRAVVGGFLDGIPGVAQVRQANRIAQAIAPEEQADEALPLVVRVLSGWVTVAALVLSLVAGWVDCEAVERLVKFLPVP